MTDAISLANYVINEFSSQKISITNLKLQKILYYTQGYSLKELNHEAFRERILMWPFGPVTPECYFAFCGYGASAIGKRTLNRPNAATLERELKIIISKILKACLDKSDKDIVKAALAEELCQNAIMGQQISLRSLQKHFLKSNPLMI